MVAWLPTPTGPSRPLEAVAVSPATDGFLPLDIATDRCKGCELCVAACALRALALDQRVINALGYHPIRLVDPPACTSCAKCARVCPDAVFTVYARTKEPR